jgi:hypothetical protein
MGLAYAIIAGLAIWLVMWSLGTKAIDAFMVTLVIALVAATVRMLAPYIPGNRDD